MHVWRSFDLTGRSGGSRYGLHEDRVPRRAARGHPDRRRSADGTSDPGNKVVSKQDDRDRRRTRREDATKLEKSALREVEGRTRGATLDQAQRSMAAGLHPGRDNFTPDGRGLGGRGLPLVDEED